MLARYIHINSGNALVFSQFMAYDFYWNNTAVGMDTSSNCNFQGAGASVGVDGLVGLDPPLYHFFYCGFTLGPWWEVDLGRSVHLA